MGQLVYSKWHSPLCKTLVLLLLVVLLLVLVISASPSHRLWGVVVRRAQARPQGSLITRQLVRYQRWSRRMLHRGGLLHGDPYGRPCRLHVAPVKLRLRKPGLLRLRALCHTPAHTCCWW
jgi:hypothetical protein